MNIANFPFKDRNDFIALLGTACAEAMVWGCVFTAVCVCILK
jgi:hypothetical protein